MELLKEIYPPKNEEERRQIEEFLDSDSSFLKRDHWRQFKSLYKAMENNPVEVELFVSMFLRLENITEADMNAEDVQPSNKTVVYMKRRIRRFMRELKDENFSLYAKIALDLLQKTSLESTIIPSYLNGGKYYANDFEKKESFQKPQQFYYNLMRHGVLDELSLKFATTYVLFGESKNYVHLNHTNGKVFYEYWHFKNNVNEIPNLELWKDFDFDYKTFFSSDKAYPWYTYEFLYFVLREKGIALEDLLENNTQLKICLNSPSSHLKIAARKKVMNALKAEKIVAFENIAHTFTIANSEDQNWIYANYAKNLEEFEKNQFNKSLINIIITKKEEFSGKVRRVKEKNIVSYLEKFQLTKKVPFRKIKDISPLILKYGNESSVADIFNMMSSDVLEHIVTFWYNSINREDEYQWQKFKEVFKMKFTDLNAEVKSVLPTLLFHENEEMKLFAWDFVAEKVKKSLVLDLIIESSVDPELYGTLNHIPAAMRVLKREVKLLTFDTIRSKTRWNTSLKNLLFSNQALEEIIFEKAKDGGLKKIYYGDDIIKFIENFRTESFIRELLLDKKIKSKIIEEMSSYWSDYIVRSFANIIAKTDDLWDVVLKYTKKSLKKKPRASFVAELVDNLTRNNKEVYKKWILLILEQEDEIYKHAKETIYTDIVQIIERAANNNQETVPLIEDFGFEFVEKILEKISLTRWVKWFGVLEDSAWSQVEEYVYGRITRISQKSNIWSVIFEIFYTEEGIVEGYKSARILENERMLELLYSPANSFILELKNPYLENVLEKWILQNKAHIQRDENLLFKITIHRLPKVRNYGYDFIREEQPEINLLLRLAESGIPEVLEFTMELFEAVKPNSPNEVHTILALCDSPVADVRERGFAMVEKRKETLDYTESNLLDCLAEHPDVFIQQKVAEAMLEIEAKEPMKFSKKFDKQVMRQKNMGRKTKELVKNRLENTQDLDADMLFELANGKDKKDAEWAILQLTKMALIDENSVSNFKLI
ncbi:hypothetical protein [Aureivirga sp. CE67]|uniref:hypothetical protein n=1 Tax=Aureivirga sp. CE67 TaxID=1788983 RepID=UPI0018C99DE4|nr:hypothetical protein [Aureivirga sp. CE67]